MVQIDHSRSIYFLPSGVRRHHRGERNYHTLFLSRSGHHFGKWDTFFRAAVRLLLSIIAADHSVAFGHLAGKLDMLISNLDDMRNHRPPGRGE